MKILKRQRLNLKRIVRPGLPVLFTLLIVMGLVFHIHLSKSQLPLVKDGLLNLEEWNGKHPFEITGEWEFYWGQLLNDEQLNYGVNKFILVDAPEKWNNYQINGVSLPGKGKATYRIHITGIKVGTQYGLRIQDMACAYELYIDGVIVARNGSFGDNETAPASYYRPQLVAFTPTSDSFDLVLQVSNNAYGIGGMWEPVIFGTYQQAEAFDRLFSYIVVSAMAGLIVTCLFFLNFFVVQRREKDALILSILSMIILLRFSIIGDVVFTLLFPNTPMAWINRIDFLTMPWAQFLLLYFIYCTYVKLIRRWQVLALLVYTVAVSLFILFFPSDTTTSAYMIMNYILLLVMIVVTVQLIRAAWQGREGAPFLLFAVLLIMLLICYEIFLQDWTISYYLINNSGFEYMIFIFAQMTVVAMRYHHAHQLEIAHLKGQIRPHFIHNALTSIISISRTKPDRARELLVDFSNYLRGFYDYEKDELISFAQELELVRAYTALEQARFGDKLGVVYCVDSECFLLPPLMLEPLVENAFVHGLREKDNGGTVTVYAIRMKNGRVRVGVRDDGVGISVKSNLVRQGVGIENINRRLYRLYHTSLVYLVPEGGGCEVYFEIPCKEVVMHEDFAD